MHEWLHENVRHNILLQQGTRYTKSNLSFGKPKLKLLIKTQTCFVRMLPHSLNNMLLKTDAGKLCRVGITHSSAEHMSEVWQDTRLLLLTWLHHVGMGPDEGSKQWADTDVCLYFCLLTLEKQLVDLKRTNAFSRPRHSAYRRLLGALWLRAPSSSVLLCLSLSSPVCALFLRARLGMSSEHTLPRVRQPCTLSRGREGPSRILSPLDNRNAKCLFLAHFLFPVVYLVVYLFSKLG